MTSTDTVQPTITKSKTARARDLLITRLCEVRNLPTKKEAKKLLNDVVGAIMRVLEENISHNKFTLKLSDFGKFTIHHRPSSMRKIPFTGETKLVSAKRKVKFNALGKLRKLEKSSS